MSYPLNYQQPYMQQGVPTASCGAVSINILNPTVGMANPMAQPYANGVYNYPQASYYSASPAPMQYPMNYNNNVVNGAPATANATATSTPAPVAPAPDNSKTAETNKEEKKEELKEKVPLTDEYVMSLENYLNSQDSKVRLMGAKDVLERFKEDTTRKNDVALTALLNKILQDPSAAVRFLGLTVLEAGYASGNEQTVELLKAIQADGQKEYGEDSLLASQILLRMSAGDKVKFKPADSSASVQANEQSQNENTQAKEAV